jgi:hypothetical protein
LRLSIGCLNDRRPDVLTANFGGTPGVFFQLSLDCRRAQAPPFRASLDATSLRM